MKAAGVTEAVTEQMKTCDSLWRSVMEQVLGEEEASGVYFLMSYLLIFPQDQSGDNISEISESFQGSSHMQHLPVVNQIAVVYHININRYSLK